MPLNNKTMRIWGLVWQRNEDGSWERHLIRKRANGKFVSDILVHVESEKPICLHCLSQDIEILITGDLKCGRCGVQYAIVEEEEV